MSGQSVRVSIVLLLIFPPCFFIPQKKEKKILKNKIRCKEYKHIAEQEIQNVRKLKNFFPCSDVKMVNLEDTLHTNANKQTNKIIIET